MAPLPLSPAHQVDHLHAVTVIYDLFTVTVAVKETPVDLHNPEHEGVFLQLQQFLNGDALTVNGQGFVVKRDVHLSGDLCLLPEGQI